jgi:positive regulator of sigma E activity
LKTQGKVIAIENKIITIEISNQEICGECGIKSDSQFALGCKSCSLFKDKNKKYLKAINHLNLTIKNGDVVKVSLPPLKVIKAGFLIFIVPLLFFFIFYFLAEYLFLWNIEFYKIAAGMIGIIMGFIFIFIRNGLLKDKEWPLVISIISS